jgi:mono/diheme cytochrome c family protein
VLVRFVRAAAVVLFVLFAVFAFGAMVSGTTAAGTIPDQARPTFTRDIAPILYSHCVVCHRPGQVAPFSLLGYDDAKEKGMEIAEATAARRMPPWRARTDRGFPLYRDASVLSERQISTLKAWVTNGMPAGDPKRLQPPPQFSRAWALGIPDVTLTLPRRIPIPADSSARLFNVLVPLSFIEDRWLRAIDFESTAAGALDHAVFFVVPRDLVVNDDDVLPGFGGLLGPAAVGNIGQRMIAADQSLDPAAVWVPGGLPRPLPNGIGHRVPRFSNLVMQLHARPTDTGAIEDGRIALYFATPPPAKRVNAILLPPSFGILSGLDVPAGGRRVLSDTFTLPVEVEAIGARGHAHRLATDVKLTARLPGGKTQTLLWIDRWDSRWHDTYYFAQSVRLPKGTTIRADITYDNTEANPHALFTPPRRVVWGPLLTDEIGAMSLLVATSRPQDVDAIALVRSEHFRDLLLKRQ